MSFLLPVDDELSLRLIEPRHAEQIFAVVDANREHLDAWMPWVHKTQSVDDLRAWAREACGNLGRQEDLQLSIMVGGEIAGGVGLHGLSDPSGSAETGYWLAADREGHGYVSRCCRFLINYGFAEFDLRRVYLWADARNARSRAVAERLGMRQEAELKQDFKTHHGEYRDSVLYAILRDEWKRGA
ncbi:MAG: GNAT family protein [Planctomycetota bacterium]